MAEAARVVEGMGADIVDVNMGCPVPKIAKHQAGCSLMRDPAHAASIVRAMTGAVGIPVTVKMRKGWDETDLSAPDVARRVEDAGAAAITIHGRTARQSYSGQADWDFVSGVARAVTIPVFGSGDCIEPDHIVSKLGAGVSGVFVGRGVLRNPWILAQARDLMNGRPPRVVTLEERGQFLLDYIQLLLDDPAREAEGFRHVAPGQAADAPTPARGRDRWVINKVRALCSWYSKGLDGGSHLRTAVNSAESIAHLRDILASFFLTDARAGHWSLTAPACRRPASASRSTWTARWPTCTPCCAARPNGCSAPPPSASDAPGPQANVAETAADAGVPSGGRRRHSATSTATSCARCGITSSASKTSGPRCRRWRWVSSRASPTPPRRADGTCSSSRRGRPPLATRPSDRRSAGSTPTGSSFPRSACSNDRAGAWRRCCSCMRSSTIAPRTASMSRRTARRRRS